MFVMNFGAGYYDPINDRWVEAVIPNDAIESENGFPGAGMPLLWLLNANEGAGYPLRVVNFLWGYAHRRDVYAAITIPDPNNTDNPQEGEDPNKLILLLKPMDLFGAIKEHLIAGVLPMEHQ